MKKLKFLIPLLFGAFVVTHAQTTVIDYGTLTSTNCNIFATGLVVSGKNHLTILGQPRKANGSLLLEAQPINTTNNPYYDKLTAFKIEGTFLANHEYNVTVYASCGSSNTAMQIQAQVLGSSGTSGNCTGPAQSSLPNLFYSNYVTSNQYTNVSIQVFAPNYNSNYIVFQVYPDIGIPTLQTMYVRRITIEDVTPQAPPFNLTTSLTSRTCGTQNPVTFTIQNPTSATVSGYKFLPEPGKWRYNGSPAPAEITSPANSIILTPESCAGNASVTGKAVWQNTDVPTNAASVSVTTPDLTIYGPDNLIPNEGGYFDVQGVTSTPINYSWPCTGSHVTWSSSVPNQSTFYNTSGVQFNTYFYTYYNILANHPFGMGITISADVDMCSVTKHLTKNVYINQPSPISKKININGNESSLELSVMPNPSNGKFKIVLNNSVENADVIITSLDGRLINRIKLNGTEANFDLSNVTSGIYFIKVVNTDEVVTERIIMQ